MAEKPAITGPSLAMRLARLAALLFILAMGTVAAFVRSDIPVATLRQEYGEKPSRFIAVDGMEVHYRDEGPRTGVPLVLLHGTSSSLHTWEGWAVRMKESRRIIRLDLPGFGLTGPRPDGDYHAATYVRFLTRFLDALGVEQVDIAGNSFGGRISWAFAAMHPGRVRRLVLVDASGLPNMPMPRIFRLARTPLRGLLRWCTPTFMVRRNVEEVYGDPSMVEDALVTRHERLLRREGNREAVIERINTAEPPSLVARLRDIRAPTLILWGKEDRWIPVEFASELHDLIPKSRLIVYQGAGHVPMEERAEDTARDVTAFLNETTR